MIKYIGSKRALLGQVTSAIAAALPDGGTVCDLFSGTARVGHALKRQGFHVWSNDHNAYAHTLATCYVQADRDYWLDRAGAVLVDNRQSIAVQIEPEKLPPPGKPSSVAMNSPAG